MKEKEILIAFLGRTLNLPAESVAELLYKKSDDGTVTEEIVEGALDALAAKDRDRVSKLKPDTKEFFDNGYKKAQAEVSAKYEKVIREKTGVQSDLTGEELIAEAISHVSKPGKLDEDKVKTHPFFLAQEKSWKDQLESAKTEGATALEQFKAAQKTESMRMAAKQKAREILLAKKPVLEDDAAIAETRIGDFLREFDSLEFQELEGGGFLPLKNGKRLENEHLHPVDFETLAQQLAAKRFKFQVSDPKGNGGNRNDTGGGTNPGAAPKNEQELWAAVNSAPPDQRKGILEAYEKANGEIKLS